MRTFKRILAVILSMIILVCGIMGGLSFNAFAAESHNVLDLVKQNKAKPIGRFTEKDGKMSAYWGGNGFELNVDSNGGEMHLTVDTNDRIFMAAFVDGELQEREVAVSSSHPDFYVNVPAGKHTVKILRDTQINTTASNYACFETLDFDGKILDAPKEKDLYIEVIGDSIAAGDGAAGHYEKGKAWKDPDDHSIVKGFAYKLAERLNADYSIIARGGIGLYKDNSGSQESTSTALRTTMQDIYDFTNGYADMEAKSNPYDFARKPDLIVFELSGNDNTSNEAEWKKLVIEFINHVRELYGDENIPVIWSGKNKTHATTISNIVKDGSLKNFYSCFFEYGGSGSAALATQSAGHPDAGEQTEIMENMIEFIKENNIIEVPEKGAEGKSEVGETEEKGESSVDTKKIAVLGGIGAAVVVIIVVIIIVAVKSGKKKEQDKKDE